LSELGQFQRTPEEDIIYHKDLRPVEYVVADVGGRLAAPVYAMFQIQDLMAAQNYTAPDGSKPAAGGSFEDAFYWLGPPPESNKMSWEWAGEWTVTYETFRDMGAAFVVALVLIYILVVWEFGNFRIPLVIMAPIPLTLLGIIPAHSLMFALGMGGEFTATSMIGWIALAGIIVRNSILLVDFAIHEIHTGVAVDEAMIRACKIRTRPILITALALVAGSSVIITDPIFQGMAISLLSGVLVSTVLTLIVIPLGCVAASKDMCEIAGASAPPGVSLPCRLMNKKGKTGRGLFGWIAEIVTLVFYVLRGIGLLLWEAFKGLLPQKPKKPAVTPKPAPSPVVAPAPESEPEEAAPESEADAPVAESPTKPRRSTTKKEEPSAEAPAPKPAAASQKKPSRRGIRLKTDDDTDQDKS
jgi:hypothetical protein